MSSLLKHYRLSNDNLRLNQVGFMLVKKIIKRPTMSLYNLFLLLLLLLELFIWPKRNWLLEVAVALIICFCNNYHYRLECDLECATFERNRRLAEALQIDTSADPFNTRSASKYTDSLKEDARSRTMLQLPLTATSRSTSGYCSCFHD